MSDFCTFFSTWAPTSTGALALLCSPRGVEEKDMKAKESTARESIREAKQGMWWRMGTPAPPPRPGTAMWGRSPCWACSCRGSTSITTSPLSGWVQNMNSYNISRVLSMKWTYLAYIWSRILAHRHSCLSDRMFSEPLLSRWEICKLCETSHGIVGGLKEHLDNTHECSRCPRGES